MRDRISLLELPMALWAQLGALSLHALLALLVACLLIGLFCLFTLLHFVAPKPRPVVPSEKTYITSSPSGRPTTPQHLPCWYDRWLAERRLGAQEQAKAKAKAKTAGASSIGADFDVDVDTDADSLPTNDPEPEAPEVLISVVFPAYNEQDRLIPTLEEAVEYLDLHYGRPKPNNITTAKAEGRGRGGAVTTAVSNGSAGKRHARGGGRSGAAISPGSTEGLSGYEILVVDDGSRDKTVKVALDFAQEHGLHDVLRVVSLTKNRGKGGSVTHGMRHVRGLYALFADADGASRFSDLGRLMEGIEDVVDGSHRGVAIGSRAHLVGSEAVVKRSALRNFLMRSFHLILTILTPPATSRIRDTQCGFKLFTRASLPHIIPYMHAEGWIFDIEMLMLAESAPATSVRSSGGAVIGTSPGIRIAEVPIEWHEVGGSKLNVIQDSVRMAIGLAILRASWMLGVYRRRLT